MREMKKLIKINIFVLILVSSAFLLSCTALEYGANLNTHRDRLIDVKTLEGMKQLDLEQRQYLQIKRYVESNGVPDYIYKDGQFSIYVIYSKLPKVVHFSMGLSGGCTIDIKDNIPKDWQYQIDASNPKEKLDSSKNIVPIVTTPSPTSGLKESELKDKVFPIKKAIDELDVIQITNVVNLMVPGAYWVPFPVEIDPCILSLTRTTEGWKYYSAPQVNGRASFLLLSVISQGDTIGIRVSVANPNDREWYVDNTNYNSNVYETIWTKSVGEEEISQYGILFMKVPSDKENITTQHSEELYYDDNTGKGKISISGQGLSARPYLLQRIGEICSSKNVVLKAGQKIPAGSYKILSENLKNGKLTIEFESIY